MYVFGTWGFVHFGPRVFPRALASEARRDPARTPWRKCGPWPKSVARSLGFNVASNHGEAFRARRVIQAHENSRSGQRLKKSPTAHVICRIWMSSTSSGIAW